MESFDLDRVTIARPCPMRWEDLAGDERRRFCEHCQLSVHDLSALPRAEAAALLAEGARSAERLCVTYVRGPARELVSADAPVRKGSDRAPRSLRSVAALLVGLGGLLLAACRPTARPDEAATDPSAGAGAGSGAASDRVPAGSRITGEVAAPTTDLRLLGYVGLDDGEIASPPTSDHE